MIRSGRVASLAVGLLIMPMVAMADGLPQLDFANKLTTYQVLWGALIFSQSHKRPDGSSRPRNERN